MVVVVGQWNVPSPPPLSPTARISISSFPLDPRWFVGRQFPSRYRTHQSVGQFTEGIYKIFPSLLHKRPSCTIGETHTWLIPSLSFGGSEDRAITFKNLLLPTPERKGWICLYPSDGFPSGWFRLPWLRQLLIVISRIQMNTHICMSRMKTVFFPCVCGRVCAI